MTTRRKKNRRSFITTTHRDHPLVAKWKHTLKGFKRNVWNLLAGIGLFWVIWQVMLRLGGG